MTSLFLDTVVIYVAQGISITRHPLVVRAISVVGSQMRGGPACLALPSGCCLPHLASLWLQFNTLFVAVTTFTINIVIVLLGPLLTALQIQCPLSGTVVLTFHISKSCLTAGEPVRLKPHSAVSPGGCALV